ncbi:acylphosphatase-2 isoform X2 [Pseudorasbora parva]|uniref:acylphosphatase-2 isoform X2 n=1 Tax=Pseudorasbora parva TaxID=51549 RepID=UPI00351E589C
MWRWPAGREFGSRRAHRRPSGGASDPCSGNPWLLQSCRCLETPLDSGRVSSGARALETQEHLHGVCFRMYTEEEGKKLGVTGWVKNTRQGTVVGQVQGPPEKVTEMKYWLSNVGSPSSRIDRAQFSNERDIPKLEIRGFGTRY